MSNALRDTRGLYHWKGESFPSVTTVLKVLDKPALVPWAAKCVAEHASTLAQDWKEKRITGTELFVRLSDVRALSGAPYRLRDGKATLGTQLHAVAEMWGKGHHVEAEMFSEELRPYVKSVLAWLCANRVNVVTSEAYVFSREFNYAGQTDAVIVLDGRRLVLDFKTSKDSYREHALQLAAYRHAEFIAIPEDNEIPMPETDGGAILVVQPDGARLVEWDCGETAFDAFLSARDYYNWHSRDIRPLERKEEAVA